VLALFRALRGWLLAIPLSIPLSLAACGDEPAIPSSDPLPEPTDPLRPASVRGDVPDHARIADYWIDARLDAERHEITGTLRLAWRNRTGRTVDHLPFHLYMNGFRAEDTAWMGQARGQHRGQKFARDRWGFVEVRRVDQLAQPIDESLLVGFETAAPSGTPLAFAEDAEPSTMTVTLGEPLGPGESIVLELEFVTRLPQVFARTGYYEDFHMAGQWFPKIAVLEEAGGWQAHTFGLFSEFYADFGNYEVRLDVPSEMVVGATGIRVGEEPVEAEPDTRKRLHYRATMVHDFAWVADPDFVEHWGEVDGILVHQLLQPERAADAQAHFDALAMTIDSMQARFGPYPWSTLTVVHPPDGAEGAGGMEYPTFITTSDIASNRWIPTWLMEERLSGVFTTVHEFGHQYFQGLFASNEHVQPWLDEGLNTLANDLAYADGYGEGPDSDPWVLRLLGHELSTGDLNLISLMIAGDHDSIDRPADRFSPLQDNAYGTLTYQKTAALFMTLRALVGAEAFDAGMRAYADHARFAHPSGAELERILITTIVEHYRSEAADHARGTEILLAGEGGPGSVWFDLREFLDEGLRGASVIDVRLIEVFNQPKLGDGGWHRESPAELAEQAGQAERPRVDIETRRAIDLALGRTPSAGPAGWRNDPASDTWGKPTADLADDEVEGVVVVQRRGSFAVPVEVWVEYADGSTELRLWDGQAPSEALVFPARVVRAVLDPRRKLQVAPRRLDDAAWSRDRADDEDDALAGWLGDVSQAADLALLGGLGL
jgi:hypothetical protein